MACVLPPTHNQVSAFAGAPSPTRPLVVNTSEQVGNAAPQAVNASITGRQCINRQGRQCINRQGRKNINTRQAIHQHRQVRYPRTQIHRPCVLEERPYAPKCDSLPALLPSVKGWHDLRKSAQQQHVTISALCWLSLHLLFLTPALQATAEAPLVVMRSAQRSGRHRIELAANASYKDPSSADLKYNTG
jgi:hypothetical protein